MQGFKSALKEYFRLQGCIHIWTQDLDETLEGKIDCYKKLVAHKKSRGIMDIREGKQPLAFEGYVKVAHTLLVGTEEMV